METQWSFVAAHEGQSLVLPDGRCDIILRSTLAQPDVVTPIITGPATQPYCVPHKKGDLWSGLRLRPQFGGALWGDELRAAQDTVLRGEAAYALLPGLEQICAEHAPVAALAQKISAWPSVSADAKLRRALDLLHLTGGRLQIEALAQYVTCSPRHLARAFAAHVGLSPKTYAQIVQFHRAFRLLKGTGAQIAALALEAGYSDHAHLTRAFRRYAGLAPSRIPEGVTLPTLHPALA